MKTRNILFAALSVILTLSACSDKLDIPRKGVFDKETYYSSDENILSASAAMYLEVRGWEYMVQLTKNILTDDFFAGGAARGDNIDLEALNEFTFTSEESYIESMFTTYYSLIYKANVILGAVDPATSDVAAMAVAEAHAFRAWAYFDLITMWGNPPVVDHELSPSEYSVPNGTTEELWKLVEDDLTAAISSGKLAEKSSVNDKETWRLTKQFAQAILGKAYLWQGKNAEAAAQFDAIVSSGKYALFTEDDYGNMFLARNEMNCESMFESVRVNDNENMGNNISIYTLMISWRSSGGEMTIPTDVCFTGGYGFLLPTQDLYDEFVKEGDTYRRTQTLKNFEEISEMGVKLNNNVVSAGYWMWKNRYANDEVAWGGWATYRHVHWMRYAEVLLLGAEAHLAAGNAAKAAEYLNQVRERARLAPKNGISLEDIKTEKRLELCGEYVRFQDLLRWGDAEKKMKGNGQYYPLCAPNGTVTMVGTNNSVYGFKAGKHDRLPYPYTETMLNGNIKQNDNY